MVEITPATKEKTDIDGLFVINPKQVTDDRGTIRELFRRSWLAENGIPTVFEQCNNTLTHHGAVRGLHAEAMTKLVTVVTGEVFGAYVDIRPGSPTFGAVVTVKITPGVMVLVPQGVCNGFQAVSPGNSEYLYFFTDEWKPGMPGGALTPLDPELDIEWPVKINPEDRLQISQKDFDAPRLSDLRASLRN